MRMNKILPVKVNVMREYTHQNDQDTKTYHHDVVVAEPSPVGSNRAKAVDF